MPLPDIPPGLEKKANEAFDAWFDNVITWEPGYQGTHGKFFQGILSSAIPDDGAESTPDPSKRPTDQAEDYADVGAVFPSHPIIAMGIDVYEGPGGHGYIVFGEIRVAGKVWRRQVDVGPSGRTYDWREVEDD